MDSVFFPPSKGQSFTIFTDNSSTMSENATSTISPFPSTNDSISLTVFTDKVLTDPFITNTTENDVYDMKSPLLPNKTKGNSQSTLKSPGFKSHSGKRAHLGEKSVNQSNNDNTTGNGKSVASAAHSKTSDGGRKILTTTAIGTESNRKAGKTISLSTKKSTEGTNSVVSVSPPLASQQDLLHKYNETLIERDRLARALGRQAEEFLLFREAMRETLEAQASKATITAASHAAAIGALRRENDGLMRHVLTMNAKQEGTTLNTLSSENTMKTPTENDSTDATNTKNSSSSLFGKLLSKKSNKGKNKEGKWNSKDDANRKETVITEESSSSNSTDKDTTATNETNIITKDDTDSTVPIPLPESSVTALPSSVSTDSTSNPNPTTTMDIPVPHHLILNSHEKESLQNYATSLTLQVSALHKALIDSEARTAVALAAAQRATETMNVLQQAQVQSITKDIQATNSTQQEGKSIASSTGTQSLATMEDTIAAYEAYLLAIGDNAVIEKVHNGEVLDLAAVFTARTNLLHHGISSSDNNNNTETFSTNSPVPTINITEEVNTFTEIPFTPLATVNNSAKTSTPMYEKAAYQAVQNFSTIFKGYNEEAVSLATPIGKEVGTHNVDNTNIDIDSTTNNIHIANSELRPVQTVRVKKQKNVTTTIPSILQSPGAPDHKHITRLINKALLSPATLATSTTSSINPNMTATVPLNKNKKLLKSSKRNFSTSRPPQLSSQTTVTNVLNNASSIVGAHAQTISQLQSALSAAQACINFYYNATLQVEEQVQQKNEELKHYENTIYQLRAIITAHQITISKHTTEQNHLSQLLSNAVQETDQVRNLNRNLLETSQQAEETLRNFALLHQTLRQGIQKVLKRNTSNKPYWNALLKQDNGMMEYLSLSNEEFMDTFKTLKGNNEPSIEPTMTMQEGIHTDINSTFQSATIESSEASTKVETRPTIMMIDQEIQTDNVYTVFPNEANSMNNFVTENDHDDDEDNDTIHDLVDRETFMINSNAYITSPSVYSVASLRSFSIYQDENLPMETTTDYQPEFTNTIKNFGSVSKQSVIQTPASAMTNKYSNVYSSSRKSMGGTHQPEFASPNESVLRLSPSTVHSHNRYVQSSKHYRTPLSTISASSSPRSSAFHNFSSLYATNDYYSTPYHPNLHNSNRTAIITDFSTDNKENIPLPVTVEDIASQTTTTVQSLLSTVAEILTLPNPVTPASIIIGDSTATCGITDTTTVEIKNDKKEIESPFFLDSIPIKNLIYGLPPSSSVTDTVWDPKDGFDTNSPGQETNGFTNVSSVFSAASLFSNLSTVPVPFESEKSITMINNVPIPSLFMENSQSLENISVVNRQTPVGKSTSTIPSMSTTMKKTFTGVSSSSSVTDHLSPYRFGLAFNPIHSNTTTNELLNNATISAYTTAYIAHQTAHNLVNESWNSMVVGNHTGMVTIPNDGSTLGPRLRSPAPALVDFSYISPNTIKQYKSLLQKNTVATTPMQAKSNATMSFTFNQTPSNNVNTTVDTRTNETFPMESSVLTPSAFPVAFPFTGKKVAQTLNTDNNNSNNSSVSTSVDQSFSDSASEYSSDIDEINENTVSIPVVTKTEKISLTKDESKFKTKQTQPVMARYGNFKGTKPISSKANGIVPPSVPSTTTISTTTTSATNISTSSRYAARVRGYSCGSTTNSIRSRSSSITSVNYKTATHSTISAASSLNSSFSMNEKVNSESIPLLSHTTTVNVHKVAEELHKLLDTVGSGSATEVFETTQKSTIIPTNHGTNNTSSLVTSALTYTSSFLASALPCNKCTSSTPCCTGCNTKGKKRSWDHAHCNSCRGTFCSSCIDSSHRLLQDTNNTAYNNGTDLPKICTGCVGNLFLTGKLSSQQQESIEKILGYHN